MNKNHIILVVLFGTLLGVFLIEPIVLSLFIHEIDAEIIHWWQYIPKIYSSVLTLNDIDQLILNLIFAITGILLVLVIRYKRLVLSAVGLRQKKETIEKLIKTGESQTVEFKSTLRWDLYQSKPNKDLEDVVVKTIVGFMNTSGGKLLIGVDDDGQILGLSKDYSTLKKENKDGFEQYIYQLISTKIGAKYSSLINVNFYKISSKEICLVDVKKSKIASFLLFKDKALFYIRSGNSTRELDAKEALEFIQETKLKI